MFFRKEIHTVLVQAVVARQWFNHLISEVLAGKELRLLPPVRHASQAEASPWPERRAPLTFLDPRLPTSRLPLTGNPYGHAKDDLALDDSRCEWRGCGIDIAHLHGARMPSLCT